jgi:hypothetical protein
MVLARCHVHHKKFASEGNLVGAAACQLHESFYFPATQPQASKMCGYDSSRVFCLPDVASEGSLVCAAHQGREFIANGALENGAFCTVFSENFHKF